MLDKKIGFIGSGNMGRAMIGGIISSGLVPASHLIASAKTQVTLDTLSEQYGIRTTLDNETVAVESDIIFLAVKPYLYETVIKEIKDSVTDDKIIVAIAAGRSYGVTSMKEDGIRKVLDGETTASELLRVAYA